jgi:hypothetical protein
MNNIPRLLRRSPLMLYVAAIVLFAWYLGNTYAELVALSQPSYGVEGLATLVKSKALFEAAREAIYIASSGAMLQILIAIYDKGEAK